MPGFFLPSVSVVRYGSKDLSRNNKPCLARVDKEAVRVPFPSNSYVKTDTVLFARLLHLQWLLFPSHPHLLRPCQLELDSWPNVGARSANDWIAITANGPYPLISTIHILAHLQRPDGLHPVVFHLTPPLTQTIGLRACRMPNHECYIIIYFRTVLLQNSGDRGEMLCPTPHPLYG